MSLNGKTNAQKIWNFLVAHGFSPAGAAGIMGNLYAESALKPSNLQSSYEKKLGHTDATYTKAVDSGEYTNFAKDGAGYGLAQWTYHTRKAALLKFCKNLGASVGDLEAQLEFLVHELADNYTGLFTFLKGCTDVKAASDKMLTVYEQPADMGDAAKEKRAGYAQGYYDEFVSVQSDATHEFIPRLSKPEAGNPYYNTRSNGGYSNAIQGKPTDPGCDVLSNCVGYAYGRFNEIGGYGSCKHLKPVNAEKFIQHAGSLEHGDSPRVGACMVWRKGNTLDGSDGAGHVAIVEKVISATEVVTSESGWGSTTPFYTKTRKRGSGNWGAGSSYTFLGFIYNPAPCCNSDKTPGAQTATSAPAKRAEIEVGDIVNFKGARHYTSSGAKSGPTCKPGAARVTAINTKALHPYHLVRISGGGSNVYGWVDKADIEQIQDANEATREESQIQDEATWKIGDIVSFKGGKHYSASTAKNGTACKPGKAKITAICTGSKHPYHLVRISGGGSNVYGWVDAGTFDRA